MARKKKEEAPKEEKAKKPEEKKAPEKKKETTRRVLTVCKKCDDNLHVTENRKVIAEVEAATCDYCASVLPCKKVEA